MKNKFFPMSAAVIHWVMAVAIIYLYISSWWMLALPYNEYRVVPFQLHKNIGMTTVVLLTALLIIRLRNKPAPIDSPAFAPFMHKLVMLAHITLYLLIFLTCLSGYLSSSFSGWGTTLWWQLDMPNWGWEDEELNKFFSEVHLWTCWALLAMIVLHVNGAVYHAFRRDGVVRRMLHL